MRWKWDVNCPGGLDIPQPITCMRAVVSRSLEEGMRTNEEVRAAVLTAIAKGINVGDT